jgi:hypothetical protein
MDHPDEKALLFLEALLKHVLYFLLVLVVKDQWVV